MSSDDDHRQSGVGACMHDRTDAHKIVAYLDLILRLCD
jgi:hypothetical protein